MKRLIEPIRIISFVLLFVLLAGCNTNEKDNRTAIKDPNYDLTQVNSLPAVNQAVANEAKEAVLKKGPIIGARSVNTDKELLIAVEVKQMDRFRLKELKKDVKKTLEKKYPEKKIEVSTDKKLFIEIDKLESKIQNQKIDKKELNKRFKEVKSLINDEA
ncbi:YhcN/YlaJ family sporulation lipoprotein [Sediminibacillus massiliensis]|uniref:YhcN/YlaJ family sporulation lipoprotein n=1 Tax=Sediminibacillus massiliensis TaxID=1926277 RepID=UPI00098850C2|nr:YhcN/YlaJ family sporulation lipoprotein [Sediminibacillus massiliensis]